MHERTRRLWDKQDQHHGDRRRLFTTVAAAVAADTVLYPGSYVDLAPSFVWPSVTSRSESYAVDARNLDTYLVPRRDVEVTRESLDASGRGVAYNRSPFAYLFERVT